jgi:hypothetical protein
MYFTCLILTATVINCQNQNGRNSGNGNGQNIAVTPAPPPPTTNCLFNNYAGYPNNNYGNNYPYYGNGYNNGYNGYNGYNGTQCGYNYSGYQGFMNYPYDQAAAQQMYMSGFCGCQSGFRPIYNSYWGLGCIEGRFVNTTSYYVGFYWNSTNSQWVNIPQVTTAPAANGGNCYMDTLLACDTSNPNTCGTAGVCYSPTGSRIGVCQYQSGYNGSNNWWGSGTR